MSKAAKKAALRQDRIMEYMRSAIEDRGYAPTVREICTALEIKSTSTVHKDLKILEEQGLIHKDPSKPRTVVLVDNDSASSRKNAKSGYTAPADSCDNADFIRTVDIPVIGNVAAGTPILADQNVESSFPVPAEYVQGTNFMLKVRGESMINAGIFDGDLILVQQQNTASNGEIVVAMVDGFESEATVKTFYREDGHIRLQPENDTMSPIIVQDARILGKVKGVFRYYN